ncbi:MAG: hypothetical protein ACI4AH_08090, partial [Muribaculaceae bacterium]
MKKLYILLIFSNLMVSKPLNAIYLLMRNFIANFVIILGVCKDFAGNRVNELGNVLRCGAVPKFSDLEVIALGFTAEAFHFDSEICSIGDLKPMAARSRGNPLKI